MAVDLGGLRTGSPPSPPSPLIRPSRRRLLWSPRSMGPGPLKPLFSLEVASVCADGIHYRAKLSQHGAVVTVQVIGDGVVLQKL